VHLSQWIASVIFSFKSLLPTMASSISFNNGMVRLRPCSCGSSLCRTAWFCCVRLQQVIPEGLLICVWVQQHSIKLFKYAQGYLSKPERLWTYTSPSNRCTDYGLQLAPEEWLKHNQSAGADVAGRRTIGQAVSHMATNSERIACLKFCRTDFAETTFNFKPSKICSYFAILLRFTKEGVSHVLMDKSLTHTHTSLTGGCLLCR